MVKDQIGDAQTQYLPLAVSIFTFILVANLAGNIPYSLSIFSSAILTMYLSVTIFLSVTVLGLVIHRVH
jgi:F-type H+-transporting ATPase subunit a